MQTPNKLHNAILSIFRAVSEEPQAKDAPLLTSGALGQTESGAGVYGSCERGPPLRKPGLSPRNDFARSLLKHKYLLFAAFY